MIKAALNPAQARSAYRRLGGALNSVGAYENRATRQILQHARFEQARSIFEFGCGTGSFAQGVLENYLPPDALYKAIDVTPEMIADTQRRLEKFEGRARIELSDGGPPTTEPSATVDRFVSNFVFDLLSQEDIEAVLAEAHRMLVPGGLLCLASLAPAQGPLSRACMGLWSTVYKHQPHWLGGCRPIELLPFLRGSSWSILHHEIIVPLGFPLEFVVAEKLTC